MKATNELKIKLFIRKIKQTFPDLTKSEFIKEYFEIEDQEELGFKGKGKDKKSKKANPTAEEEEYDQLLVNQFKYTKGWVFLDFPNDIESAEAFEKVFTGIISPKDKINQTAEKLKEESEQIVKPTEKEAVKQELLKGMFTNVFLLDITSEEVFKRVNGRRVDPQTE